MGGGRGGEGPAPAARTEFRVLGPVAASRDGAELELGPRKQRAVLAVLLLNENRVVPTERLIDELWGDTPPETARAALQVYVAGLRKALGESGAALTTRSPGYVLAVEDGALDVDRFAALRERARAATDARERSALLHEALDLWRDEPLADLDGEPFAAAVRPRLDELRLGALEERIDADLALGRHAELVGELDALVGDNPYRERLRGQQMVALYRSGRQADALAAYRAAREASVEDLGLEPGPELRALERAILDHDPELAAPVAMPVPAQHGTLVARRRRRRGVRAAAGVALLAGAGVVLVMLLERGPRSVAVSPDTVAVIDAGSRRVVADVPVGIRPGSMAADGTTLWVANEDDHTLTRLETRTRKVQQNVPVPAGRPSGIAVGRAAVWVVHGRLGLLSRVAFDRVTDTIRVAPRAIRYPAGAVDVGPGAVWVGAGDLTLSRVSPATLERTGSTFTGHGPSAVLAAYGAVWVACAGDSTVRSYSPQAWKEGPVSSTPVGRTPSALAAGDGAIWVANYGDDTVWRLDTTAASISAKQIDVGDGPIAIAYGAGAIWVANREDGSVWRIDPRTNKVSGRPIELGSAPSGIAVVGGEVWVSVQAP
jgi:DNA-binding SARP family transcriptional activator/DNA-binding beta-propeller fold protein YncE